MAHIDNSKKFGRGLYTDVSVYVPANTTYKAGTVLGRDAEENLTAFTSDNADSTPLYILAQDVVNDGEAAETFDLVRALEAGEVDKAEIIFAKEADSTNKKVLDALKVNNIRLLGVQEQTEPTSLGE